MSGFGETALSALREQIAKRLGTAFQLDEANIRALCAMLEERGDVSWQAGGEREAEAWWYASGRLRALHSPTRPTDDESAGTDR